ncbi:MAG: cadmium-translocating P-type ATPase [Bacilli bacterium]|nr:cadmium-translocating P-type ATPase [Bacilli bacterium]
MRYSYNIKNLTCANCAKKLEDTLNKYENIKKAIVNFNTSKVTIETNLSKPFNYVKNIVSKVEPEALLYETEIKENRLIPFIKLSLGAVIGIIGYIIKLPYNLNIILVIIGYSILIYKTLITAIKQLFKGSLNENLLVVLSTIGAFILGETLEGLMVIFLYQLGKILESLAVSKSRKSVAELMNIKEETANLKEKNTIKKVNAETISKGDIIVIKGGEKIPLDGIIVKGEAYLDASALTGESNLLYVKEKDKVLSGTINKQGLLEIKVTSLYKESTVSKILELVETATDKKSKTETIVSKYSSKYTIGVLLIAILVAVFLPLFTSFTYQESIYKGLTILVISCPCAIAISVPLSYFSGIGRASKEGILVKGSNHLDNIKNVKEIIFDKTGTITTGKFCVSKINIYDNTYTEDQILEIYAKGEALSNHPIAKSIIKKYGKEVSSKDIEDYKEMTGKGITFKYKNKNIKIGSANFCRIKEDNQNIYLKINNKIISSLELKDEIKENTKEVINKLQNLNIKIHIFTGDSKEKGKEVGKMLGIKNINYEMLPDDKYKELEKILKNKKENTIVSFVGDGINDAPVLALSDLGISMGNLGSDSAIEASDVVIMNDNLEKIITAIKISKKTNKIIKQNLIFAITVKLSVLILSLLGISTMWEAVFADVGVTVLCILNTLRLLKK